MSIAGDIGRLALGQLVSRGAEQFLNRGQDKTNKFIDNVTGGGITGVGTGTKSKGKSTFGSIAKQGIMGLIARSILGPIFGPLALTLGTNIFNKNKGLGFFNKGDGITKGPPGIPKGPFIDPDTPIDEGFQVTGTYGGNDFYSAEGTTVDEETGDLTDASGNYAGNIVDEFAQPTPPSPPSNNDSNGDSGGGQSDSQAGADASQSASDEDAGAGGYAYGGRASYSGGGLASLYR